MKERILEILKRGTAVGMLVFETSCTSTTFTPEPSLEYTGEPVPTQTPMPPTPPLPRTPEKTATSIFYAIDQENQRILENAEGGETLTLKSPNITSIWRVPWPSKGEEPKASYILAIGGDNSTAALLTSGRCVWKAYKEMDNLGEERIPFYFPGKFGVWTPSPQVRVEEITVKISNYSGLADTETVKYRVGNEIKEAKCEETKELARFQEFLYKLKDNWRSIPGEAGKITGEVIGRFTRGFWEGWLMSGTAVPQ